MDTKATTLYISFVPQNFSECKGSSIVKNANLHCYGWMCIASRAIFMWMFWFLGW